MRISDLSSYLCAADLARRYAPTSPGIAGEGGTRRASGGRVRELLLLRRRLLAARRGGERLFEIGDDVVDMLEPDGEPHVVVGDAGRQLVLGRELGVGGGGGMDGEAARVAEIGDVIEELQRVDEAASGLLAAGKLEAHQPAIAALEIEIGRAHV